MGIRILLADDSVTAQNMGKKILSEAGHEVVTVSNGAAAAKKIAEMKPDLALLDVFMPGYSGLELCEKLRNAADTTRLPVILTVGKMEPYSPQDGARVKADGVIIKPFEASDLTAAVERLAQKLKSVAKSTPNGRKSEKPANYEPTVRLDSKQIAAMLKSGGPESSNKTDSALPSPEASGAAVGIEAEEFHVSTAQPEAQEAATPAFGDELTASSKAESMSATMNSYMEEYLSDTAAIAVEPVTRPSPQSEDQRADIAASNELPVSTFESQVSSDAPVVPLDGFEPTATAAVDEMPIAQEPGFEATQQSSEALNAAMKDPALETDPHQATTAFPTKFGTAEGNIYGAPMTSVPQEVVAESDATLEATISGHLDGDSQQLARPIDEFEARLQQAMAAYQTESESAAITPGESLTQSSQDSELQIAAETQPSSESSASFESRVQAAMHNFEDISGETQHAASSEAPESAAAAEFNETRAFDAMATEEIPPPDHETTMAAARLAPETDDTVIQQMRDSFSEHSVNGASITELGSDTESIPLAVAAAAAQTVPSFVSPPSVSHEREAAAFEITRALSYAVSAETSSETGGQPADSPSPETEARDGNKMAGVVERVLQRELPSLVWKVMAEIDLEKQRR